MPTRATAVACCAAWKGGWSGVCPIRRATFAALSGVIAAGLDGIDHAMQAPPACEEDLYERFAQDLSMPEQLPTSLQAATQGLAQNTRLQAAVGEAFCEQVLLLQREQWRKWLAHVTGWEWQQYGDFYE